MSSYQNGTQKPHKYMKISVIVCTHNPREDYLRRTLEGLEQQTLPQDRWELLLIDNSSKEPLAGKWDLSWHPQGRHVLEEELGLTPARLRGIREAKGDLLVFVDDDNVLDRDYLQQALEIAGRMPLLGCFGAGHLEPEYEEEPENGLRAYVGMLALRTVSEPRWSNVPDDPWVPWGAGLCVTRLVAQQHMKEVCGSETSSMLDRKGSELNSGGDDEFSWTACAMGLGRGIFPALQVLHLIDRRRVQPEYLLRIAEGHAFSSSILKSLHGKELVEVSGSPKFLSVMSGFFRLSPSLFFYEGQRWWNARKAGKTVAAFDKAFYDGVGRARRFLDSKVSG
jgi:hypothetical protein